MQSIFPDTLRLRKWKAVPLLLVILIFSGQAGAQDVKPEKKSKKIPPLDVEFTLSTIHDDNILKYSDKYLDRFHNNQDKGRFHINTCDDIILDPGLELASTFILFGKLKSRINLDASYKTYIVNPVKNWGTWGLGFQQFLTKKASLKILYSYIPDFYVRHFRDADRVAVYKYTPETFVPFAFAKDNFGFWIQNTFLKNTRIRLSLYYARYFHNAHYTEYDCNNLQYGFDIFQPVHKKFRIQAGYHYITSDAKGYDESGETRENSDDADATYVEDGFSLGYVWQLPALKKRENSLEMDFEYEKRYFTTKNYLEEDPEHAGRVDENLYLQILYEMKLKKNLVLSAFYKFYKRNTDTEATVNREYISEEKDYRQNQTGLKITWNLVLNKPKPKKK